MAARTVAKRRAGLLLLFISSNDGSRDRKALRTGRHPGMELKSGLSLREAVRRHSE